MFLIFLKCIKTSNKTEVVLILVTKESKKRWNRINLPKDNMPKKKIKKKKDYNQSLLKKTRVNIAP